MVMNRLRNERKTYKKTNRLGLNMNRSILVILIIIVLGCTKTKNSLSEQELEGEIKKATEQNLATKTLVDGWYHISNDSNEFKKIEKGNEAYYINPNPIVLPINFERGEEFKNHEGDEGLAIYFDKMGIEKWAEATKKAEGSSLIFILSNSILSVQSVNSQITNGASAFWKASLSEEDYKKLKEIAIK